MSEKYGSDAVKFFIGTAVGVGKDIDYTEEWFHAVYTDQLANNYGNYVNRSITLFLKSFPDGIDTQKLEYRF